jgi:hypothetical protein
MGRLQDQITIDSLAAVTASRNSPNFNMNGYTSGTFYFNLTAVSGTTPTLAPALQASVDGTNFTTVPTTLLASISNITATGLVIATLLLPAALPICRFAYTVGGTTPSFTGTVVGIFNHS